MSESNEVDGRADEAPPPASMAAARDMTLLMTYRFLRIGLVMAVFALCASLIIEIIRTECVRGSVSGYFYSPVRTIFVGSLLAIGLCLIALQGEGDTEEFSLNLAGMFAPMVAVIPTSVNTQCDPDFAMLGSDGRAAVVAEIEAQTRAGVTNNAIAYFGALGLLFVIMLIWPKQFSKAPNDPARVAKVRQGVAVYIVVVGAFVILASAGWNSDNPWAHNLSAIFMFVAFGVVALRNWRGHHERPVSSRYIAVCRFVTIGMGVGVVLAIVLTLAGVDRTVFIVEAVEIVLFGVFWVAQTIEFWHRDRTVMAVSSA